MSTQPVDAADRRVPLEGGLHDVEHPRAVHLREPERELHRRPVAGEVVRADGQVRELPVGELRVPGQVLRECPLVVLVADRLAQAPRTGVEHDEHLAGLVPLDLEEVIATTKTAQLPERVGQPLLLDRRRPLQTHGLGGDLAVDRGGQLLEAGRDARIDGLEHPIELAGRQRLDGQVRLDERHAAADVDADGVRHDRTIGEEHPTDRHAVAGVRVGHERDVIDGERQVRQVGRLLERRALERHGPRHDRDAAGLADPRAERRLRVGHAERGGCLGLGGHGCWTSGQRTGGVSG